MKSKIKMRNYISIAMLVLLSIVFLFVGVIRKSNVDNFMGTAEKVEARICDIDTYTERNYKGRRITKHKVYVDYTVDGIIYDHIQLDSYNSSMRVGKIIEIYYNPKKPKQIKSGDTSTFTIMMFAGAGFMVAAILIAVIMTVKSSGRKKLIANGKAYTGKIIYIKEITSEKTNGRHPYQAECEVINPITQERFVVSSEKVNDDIRPLVGVPVVVYMDNNTPPKHFVDIDKAIADYEEWRRTH